VWIIPRIMYCISTETSTGRNKQDKYGFNTYSRNWKVLALNNPNMINVFSSRTKWCMFYTQMILYWLVQTNRRLNKQFNKWKKLV
jgi:hypothetical protein